MMVGSGRTPSRKSGNRDALQDLTHPPRLSSTPLYTMAGVAGNPPGKHPVLEIRPLASHQLSGYEMKIVTLDEAEDRAEDSGPEGID